MANYSQKTRNAFYADETMKNTEASASISAGYVVQLDGTTYSTAPDPIPVKNVDTSDAAAVAWAICVDDTVAAGATGRFCTFGYVDAIAGTGGVTINDLLTLDSATSYEGCVKTLTPGSVTSAKCLGRAMHTASALEKVKIFFSPGFGLA